jgi:hypothetical protein
MVRICMCEHHERVFYSKEPNIDPYEVYVMDCSKVGEKGWECLVVEWNEPA